MATFGTLSLAASGSDGQGDSGQQYLLGYSYYSRRLGLSLQHIERSAGYGDLGTLDGEYQLSWRTDQATASLTFDEHGPSVPATSTSAPATAAARAWPTFLQPPDRQP